MQTTDYVSRTDSHVMNFNLDQIDGDNSGLSQEGGLRKRPMSPFGRADAIEAQIEDEKSETEEL